MCVCVVTEDVAMNRYWSLSLLASAEQSTGLFVAAEAVGGLAPSASGLEDVPCFVLSCIVDGGVVADGGVVDWLLVFANVSRSFLRCC